MIPGAHTIIYSTNPEADRAFLRELPPGCGGLATLAADAGRSTDALPVRCG